MGLFDPSADELRRSIASTYSRNFITTGTQLAGYSGEQLAELPAGVAEEFYGCGNPLAFAEVRPGQTVLDLGSGAGLDLILAARAVGATGRVIGVDMTDEMIARARRNVERAGLSNIEIRKGIIEQLPIEDASIDWVISNCVISLSPDKEAVFREVARVLAPGGRMMISDTVVDEPLGWVLKRLTRIAPSIALARTEAHYLRALERARLVDVEIKSRFVYEADHLIGLFGDQLASIGPSGPVSFIAARATASSAAERVVAFAARRVAGHVWSSKFHARRA